MSALGMLGFLSSVWLFSEYASNDPFEQTEKKYKSYETLKNQVYPAIKEGNTDLLGSSLENYFSYLKKEIYKPE